MQNILDLQTIASAHVKTRPYPYFTVDRVISDTYLSETLSAFPDIDLGGSFNLDDVMVTPAFQRFLDSIDSAKFRQLIHDKLDVDVSTQPMMMTLRGYSRKKDGRIHTDSKTKLVTVLIYLNEDWQAATGRLRVLNNADDMNDYAEEISPGPGTMIAFKITDNCWHGYPSYEGTRRSIQINFLASEKASRKHRFFHRLSAKFKTWRRNLKSGGKA